MSQQQMESLFKNSRLHNKYDTSIPSVRTKVLDIVSSCSNDVYGQDIDNKIKNGDTFVRRFLVYNHGNVEESANQIVAALKWYKSSGFHELTDSFFPSEMWSMGGVFLYEPDLQGHPSMFVRLRSCIKVPEINDMVKKYISYLIWKLDQAGHESGWIMIFDFEGASMFNADMDIAKYFLSTLKNYFPIGLNYAIAVELPWYIKTFWIMIRGLLPADKRSLLMVAPKAQMDKYFAPENLPKFLGGSCTRKYQGNSVIPEGAPSSIDFGVKIMGYPAEKSEKLFKNFDHLIAEIQKEENLEKNS